MSKEKAKKEEVKAAVLSKFCTGKPREIERRELKGAPYNPRRGLTDKEREKLKGSLSSFGLVDLPVWNKRTGNIVGGHQRLSILDALEGSDSYRLFVSEVDIDDPTEKALNVALNNTELMSDFDVEKLGTLMKEIDFKLAGFDQAGLMQMFGDDIFKGDQAGALSELNDQVRAARERYDKMKVEKFAKRDDLEYYAVLVFESAEKRVEFAKLLGLDDNKWLDGAYVAKRLSAPSVV